MKDSVLIKENTVEIFLADTSSVAARGVCTYNVVLDFKVETSRRIKVAFYYKAATLNEYHKLVKHDISIQQ